MDQGWEMPDVHHLVHFVLIFSYDCMDHQLQDLEISVVHHLVHFGLTFSYGCMDQGWEMPDVHHLVHFVLTVSYVRMDPLQDLEISGVHHPLHLLTFLTSIRCPFWPAYIGISLSVGKYVNRVFPKVSCS